MQTNVAAIFVFGIVGNLVFTYIYSRSVFALVTACLAALLGYGLGVRHERSRE